MPCRPVRYQKDIVLWISSRQLAQERVHVIRVAVWHDQKEVLACHGFYRTVQVFIFPNMMTRNRRTYTFRTPAHLRLVDPSEACFILKHQADCLIHVGRTSLLHGLLNFFEASHASSFAAFGCFGLGMTFRHPCRFNNM